MFWLVLRVSFALGEIAHLPDENRTHVPMITHQTPPISLLTSIRGPLQGIGFGLRPAAAARSPLGTTTLPLLGHIYYYEWDAKPEEITCQKSFAPS